MGDESPAKLKPYAALESVNYRLFASGFLFSSMGLQMLGLAVGWEIYKRTDSEFMVGLAGLVRSLPVVLMALPAGWVIDRFHRQRVLVLTQLGFGVMAALLAVVSHAQMNVAWMYAMLFMMGCVRSFNGPSRSSLLPDLVPPGVFANAVTWTTGLFHVSAAAGPIAAGFVIAAWNEQEWPVYACTSVGCFVFAISSMMMDVPHARGGAPSTGKRSVLHMKDMFAGASYVWREKTVLATITLDLFAVLFGGVTALLPVYAVKILHVDSQGAGVLRAAPFLGAIVMSVVLAHRPAMRRAGMTLLWSVAGYGVCIIGFGLSTSFLLSLAILFASGALDSISVVIRHVLVQARTPRELRGRVSAVNSVFIECSNELGSFESGLVAKAFGPVASAVSGGIGTLLVVIGVAYAMPQIRKLDRLEEANDITLPPASNAGDVEIPESQGAKSSTGRVAK